MKINFSRNAGTRLGKSIYAKIKVGVLKNVAKITLTSMLLFWGEQTVGCVEVFGAYASELVIYTE